MRGEHYPTKLRREAVDYSTPLIRENDKCVQCLRCIQVCENVQSVKIWDLLGTGSRTVVDASYNRRIQDTECTYCGQCITHCPTAALREEMLRSKTEMLMRIVELAGIHGTIDLEVKVNEQIRASRPIKLEDRMRYITEKNPLVAELRKALDLEAE